MLVTNFRLKYRLYRFVLAGYQLLGTGRLHPARGTKRTLISQKSLWDHIIPTDHFGAAAEAECAWEALIVAAENLLGVKSLQDKLARV